MLAEKEVVNVALRENYLLKQCVQGAQGQASEGEGDVKQKCLKVTQDSSDDHTSHPNQDGQEPQEP